MIQDAFQTNFSEVQYFGEFSYYTLNNRTSSSPY